MPAPDTLLQSRYRIIRLLAEGGMGAVYLARDERLKRDVALKECLFTDEGLRRAFEREALLLANLNHPALPRVIDHFTEGTGQFLVMDFIEGDDLAVMIVRRANPFPLDDVMRWAGELLDALEYLHSRQPPIIHRDIKPQNIKINDAGRIVLLDFGLAKGAAWHESQMATGRSVQGYTPSYAPIEQIKGTGTDARSDLYSLAATLYHLLTGEPPVDALTRVTDIATEDADPLRPANEVNPHVPSTVAAVLKRATAIKPDHRPTSVAEMRSMLKDDSEPLAAEKNDELITMAESPVTQVITEVTALEHDHATQGHSVETTDQNRKEAIIDEPQTIDVKASDSQPVGPIPKTVTAVAGKSKTTGLWKRAVLAVTIIAAVALFVWALAGSPLSSQATIKLTSRDLELIANELMPPQQRARLVSDPESKKIFLKSLKQILALSQMAEQENIHQQPETKIRVDFQIDLTLSQAYKKKNPDGTVSEAEANSYFQAHPDEWNAFLEANPRFKQQAEQVKKEYLQVKVMAERARGEGLDKEELTKLSLLIQRSQVLAEAYIRELQKNLGDLVSDQEVEQYYNEHKNEFEEVRARHILVGTSAPENIQTGNDQKKPASQKALTKEEARKKAQSLLDRIRRGEDFAKLAVENSDDPGSKAQGGEMPFFSRGEMVPEFDQAAFSMSAGQLSELVETQFGFHIIRVEERRTSPLDEKTKEKIKGKLEQGAFEKKIDEIVSKAKLEMADDFNVNAPLQPPASLGNPNQ